MNVTGSEYGFIERYVDRGYVMKRQRAFFHTIHVPFSRLVLPSLLLVIFAATAYSVLSSHQKTGSIIKFSPAVVMIDAGHGGYDPGVTTNRGDEADIVLAIAQKLKSALEKRGIPAQLTRETDTDFAQRGQRGKDAKRTDLAKRLESTEREQAQIFVSLHANKSSLASRGGAEVFYDEGMPGSKELAEIIQNALLELPDMSPRSAKAGDYYLLRNQQRPAVIVECGYLNFPAELARLTTPSYQQKFADAVAGAIERYLQQQKERP